MTVPRPARLLPGLGAAMLTACVPAILPAQSNTAQLNAAQPYAAQPSPAGTTAPSSPYADLADLALAAPVVLDGTVRSTARIKGVEAAGLAPGTARLYVTADVAALVRGTQGLPPRVGYLLDVPLDARGRVPKFRKQRVLVFARPVAGDATQLQLVAPDAQLPWSPADDATVRAIVRASVAADAPPVVTGVRSAFHVPGALPGEGETQIFLRTADERPLSLSILRRPGEAPRWAVALGEIVDESAALPARDSLLWYRLACSLPAELPATALTSAEPRDAAIAQDDYRVVQRGLGACGRTRGDTAGAQVSGGASPA